MLGCSCATITHPMENPMPLAERPFVRTDAELVELCADLRAARRFAFDTEFLSEGVYVPRLCLVQVATTEFIALVDTLAVRDLSPLWALIADPDVQVVLHAAREDLRLAYYGGGSLLPANVFDTQIAAGLIGLSPYPLSYARLTEALTGVKLSKGETRSPWDRRPLTPEQTDYARDDVRYLLPLTDKLSSMLERLGRASWMTEEMARFALPGTFEPDPELAYLRLRGPRAGLGRRPTAVARELAAWREREAAARNIPARMILQDETLVNIALRPPRRLSDFLRIKGFPAGEEVHIGPGMLDAITLAQGLADEQTPAPLAGGGDETPAQQAVADVLFALGNALCLMRGLAPDLVLSRADALSLAKGGGTPALLTGWRKEAVGDELARLASGTATAAISVTADGPQVKISEAPPAPQVWGEEVQGS